MRELAGTGVGGDGDGDLGRFFKQASLQSCDAVYRWRFASAPVGAIARRQDAAFNYNTTLCTCRLVAAVIIAAQRTRSSDMERSTLHSSQGRWPAALPRGLSGRFLGFLL
ncbi:hypothetical protein N8D55_04410 [Xanthomonas hortorum pv. pelargonii]|nr:hypothetical protein N8D55_04410 [Xanthomonas hortorum pv. pelargonii]